MKLTLGTIWPSLISQQPEHFTTTPAAPDTTPQPRPLLRLLWLRCLLWAASASGARRNQQGKIVPICFPLFNPRGLHRIPRCPDTISPDSPACVCPQIPKSFIRLQLKGEVRLALENYKIPREIWGGAHREL